MLNNNDMSGMSESVTGLEYWIRSLQNLTEQYEIVTKVSQAELQAEKMMAQMIQLAENQQCVVDSQAYLSRRLTYAAIAQLVWVIFALLIVIVNVLVLRRMWVKNRIRTRELERRIAQTHWAVHTVIDQEPEQVVELRSVGVDRGSHQTIACTKVGMCDDNVTGQLTSIREGCEESESGSGSGQTTTPADRPQSSANLEQQTTSL